MRLARIASQRRPSRIAMYGLHPSDHGPPPVFEINPPDLKSIVARVREIRR